MRSALAGVGAGLVLVMVAPAEAQQWTPPAAWLAQAKCIHAREGAWTANTGNGYFGGMQFAKQTWLAAKGSVQPALAHPGDPAYPFMAAPREQLQVAWRQWVRDGRTWKAWGAVGVACSRAG
jgi:resuscitation-promoting factor RpfA